jgi:hypothetical protein
MAAANVRTTLRLVDSLALVRPVSQRIINLYISEPSAFAAGTVPTC